MMACWDNAAAPVFVEFNKLRQKSGKFPNIRQVALFPGCQQTIKQSFDYWIAENMPHTAPDKALLCLG
jgi:isocitrate/isopropylmalate dehydrogenase